MKRRWERQEITAALAGLGAEDPAWQAVLAVARAEREEARDRVEMPGLSDADRHYWSGAAAMGSTIMAALHQAREKGGDQSRGK